ncbi:MAG: toprim domain-containing protein [Candidatus Paceibacterota bacterium]|jgi:recombinational DNA repair protein RecR
MIVAKDIDLENIKRSGAYTGRYFVLGGLLPILEKHPEEKIRTTKLKDLLTTTLEKDNLREVIVALSANPEGDYTADFLKKYIGDIASATNPSTQIKISVLGRGLSTGTELEYSDSDTIKNALKNRE